METECLSLDRISTLPQNITDTILSRMPIRDALRTSILSKKWRYSWRSMPGLVFTDDMVKMPPHHGCIELKKYKLVNAIFHVLLFHNGPTLLEFRCSVGELQMDSEFEQIISYLSKENSVKEVIFIFKESHCNLPVSFFSLQGLEHIHLKNCGFEPSITFNGFSRLKCIIFMNVKISAKMLQGFLSNCPLLDEVYLNEDDLGNTDFVAGGNKFTFVELFQCAPLIKILDISEYYMTYLCAGGMPHKLPTSPVNLKYLFLEVCFMDQNEISSVLCMIRSSPLLVELFIEMFDSETLPIRQIPNNFLDPEHYSDLKLAHLETLLINMFSNLPLEMEFVKLIMAKSPVLKKVQILISSNTSVDEELKILRDFVLLPFPRASPSAKLIIKRAEAELSSS